MRKASKDTYLHGYSFIATTQQFCEESNATAFVALSPIFDWRGNIAGHPFPNHTELLVDDVVRIDVMGWQLWASLSNDTLSCKFNQVQSTALTVAT